MKLIVKILVDAAMTALLFILMTFDLIGGTIHEWLGIMIYVLFVIHHFLNAKWTALLSKGKYSAFRILQTVLAILVFVAMLGSMISGIILSRYALKFFEIQHGQSFARNLHMLSAYWGFILISLHLGLHGKVFIGITKRKVKAKSSTLKWIIRAIALVISGYGIHAVFKREIGSYMLLKKPYVFFDFDEPLILFLLDYIAIMVLFATVGHYLSMLMRRFGKQDVANDLH